MTNHWRYFVVEIQNDSPEFVRIGGDLISVIPHKEHLLQILTFRHMIRGWIMKKGKIIICLTRKVSLPSLRHSLGKFLEEYPDCEVTEVLCEGSEVTMRYYH